MEKERKNNESEFDKLMQPQTEEEIRKRLQDKADKGLDGDFEHYCSILKSDFDYYASMYPEAIGDDYKAKALFKLSMAKYLADSALISWGEFDYVNTWAISHMNKPEKE